MLCKIRTLFIGVLLLLVIKTNAQEELGYVNSNYAGVNSLGINPSFNVDSKIFIDVHVIGAHLFAHNNAGYFPQEHFSLLTGKTGDLVFDEREVTKRGFVKTEIMGPSVAVSWKKHSFGLFTKFRSYLDASLSSKLFILALDGFNYDKYIGDQLSEKGTMAFLSWFETGLSYGYMHKLDNKHTLDFGINVKRLNGIGSAAVSMDQFDFILNQNKDISIITASGGYRLSDVGWNIGKGFGFDLGVNYQKKLYDIERYEPNAKGNCKHIDYKYRLGLSFLDIGYIGIKQNAIAREFIYQSQNFNFDTANVNTPADADAYLNQSLINSSAQQSSKRAYTALTPFALSLQFDYNFGKGFFINATTVNSFKVKYQVKRIDVLSITPRYERKWFEVAIPISLVGYNYLQAGVAVRLGQHFIIGTNRLTGITGRVRDVYGSNLYFHLKFAIFRKCKEGKPKRNKKACKAYGNG